MSQLYLGYISAVFQLSLGYISAISQLYLGYISALSQQYLGNISDKFHANPLSISSTIPYLVPCTCYNRECLADLIYNADSSKLLLFFSNSQSASLAPSQPRGLVRSLIFFQYLKKMAVKNTAMFLLNL